MYANIDAWLDLRRSWHKHAVTISAASFSVGLYMHLCSCSYCKHECCRCSVLVFLFSLFLCTFLSFTNDLLLFCVKSKATCIMQNTRHTKQMNILLLVQCFFNLSHSVVGKWCTRTSVFFLPICIILPNKIFNKLCKSISCNGENTTCPPSEVAE